MGKKANASYARDLVTMYWLDRRHKLPMTRGYPKGQEGSAKGAGKVIMAGFANKVQCINRHTGRVYWTAEKVKVPGLASVYAVRVTVGDGEGA